MILRGGTVGPMLAVCLLAVGCKAKELGAHVSPTQATQVDPTWITATRNCWPDLSKAHKDKFIANSLADPIAFRGAFAGFASYSDAQVESIAAHNVGDSPDPDTSSLRNANAPLLTRTQALAPPATRTANAPDTHDAAQIPPDTLCAIHPGTPVGFR